MRFFTPPLSPVVLFSAKRGERFGKIDFSLLNIRRMLGVDIFNADVTAFVEGLYLLGDGASIHVI
jgi:hypothetical protein